MDCNELLLADVNKVVGVVVGLIGAFIVSPDGTRRLRKAIFGWMSGQARRLLSWLPWFRGEETVHKVDVDAGGALETHANLTATGEVWPAGIQEQVEALRTKIAEVEGRVNNTARDLREESGVRRAAIAELEGMLKRETNELRGLLERAQRDVADFDAIGLPLIGIGILLSGIPELLASMWFLVAWLFPVAAIAITAGAVYLHVQRRRSL